MKNHFLRHVYYAQSELGAFFWARNQYVNWAVHYRTWKPTKDKYPLWIGNLATENMKSHYEDFLRNRRT